MEQQAERILAQETAELKAAIEPFRQVLQDRTIFVGGGEARVLTTAEFYQSIGMKVLGVKAHNLDCFVENLLNDIQEPGLLVEVAAGQPAEELNVLNRLRPDLYIGHAGANGWVTKLM